MLDASAETAHMQEALLVCDRTAEEQAAFNEAYDEAWQAGEQHKMKNQLSSVRHKLSICVQERKLVDPECEMT